MTNSNKNQNKANKTENKMKNLHANHRARLRNRFKNEGIENFETHNVIELLLFYAIPRVDTNPLAHELLNEFGSLRAILDAPHENLVKVKGVGENAALFIKFIRSLMGRYELDKTSYDGLSDIDDIAEYMVNYYKYIDEQNETLIVLLLDNNKKLYKIVKVCEGDVNSVSIPIREISNILHRYNASSYILVHNHPHGKALPSREDIQLTLKTDEVLGRLNFELKEHIIIAEDEYYLTFNHAKQRSRNRNTHNTNKG